MMRDQLIPLDKIIQWYPNIKLSKKYGPIIQNWAKLSLQERMTFLKEWAEFAFDVCKKEKERKKDIVFTPFNDAGGTEDEAAIMLGYQPHAWEQDTKFWNFLPDLLNNLKNYKYILKWGKKIMDDDNPYMKLDTGLREYFIRKVYGDDIYLLLLAKRILDDTFHAYNDFTNLQQEKKFDALPEKDLLVFEQLQQFIQEMLEKKDISPEKQYQLSNDDFATFMKNFLNKVKAAEKETAAKKEPAADKTIQWYTQWLKQ